LVWFAAGLAGSLESVSDDGIGEATGEVRSALEWVEVKAMAADGVSTSEIARRLGVNWRMAARLVSASEPPSYSRAPAGSMLDPLEPVLRQLIVDWEDIKAPRVTEILRDDYGYAGSVDLVRKRLATLRPSRVRPAQRTGQVLQLDWGEMPTRPKIAGRERRVYALVATLPYSGAQTAHFSYDLTTESFLEGHVRIFDWLGGVVREGVYDNLRSAVARREGDQVIWSPAVPRLARPLCVPRHGLHALCRTAPAHARLTARRTSASSTRRAAPPSRSGRRRDRRARRRTA